jgi:hypothetical protein
VLPKAAEEDRCKCARPRRSSRDVAAAENDLSRRRSGSGEVCERCVAKIDDGARTQDGHIRNDTRDVSRRIWTACNSPICRRKRVVSDRACTPVTLRNLHGKEGVEGSSPEEGFRKAAANCPVPQPCRRTTKRMARAVLATTARSRRPSSTTSRRRRSRRHESAAYGASEPNQKLRGRVARRARGAWLLCAFGAHVLVVGGAT